MAKIRQEPECPLCGYSEIEENSEYCPECGETLEPDKN